MPDIISLKDSFIRGLACASLHPGLRNILIFDISPSEVEWFAEIFRQMLYVVEGTSIDKTMLGTTESDDILWGSLNLQEKPDGTAFDWQTGLLKGGQKKENGYGIRYQIIYVPDLTHLSLAASRSAVLTMGADVVHFERHVHQDPWHPEIYWLAGCASAETGQVSPHLLDRFALRLSMSSPVNMNESERVSSLLDNIKNQRKERVKLPDEIVDVLLQASQHHPILKPDAVSQVLKYFPTASGIPGSRREIALGRLSVSNAAIDLSSEVTPYHVDKAAEIIGLKKSLSGQTEKISDHEPVEPETLSVREKHPDAEFSIEKESITSSSKPESDKIPICEPDTEKSLTPEPLILHIINPYPEDLAPVNRDVTPLCLPLSRSSKQPGDRGVIVGTKRATKLHDIAVVNTIFEAVKYHPIRCKYGNYDCFRISSSDLRSYIRVPVPEKMLVLLIDYTCLSHCQAEDILIDHLQWAYVERASICLIRVGSANAGNYLRADRFIARSIMVPHISAALEDMPGSATPLAHGLDLALKTLRHNLQHGRNTVSEARLIALSDGRGNVPLDASSTGHIRMPVNREGIDDALKIAAQIRCLECVTSVFLNPQPKQYAELPEELAHALGAKLIDIPLKKSPPEELITATANTCEEMQ
ncbi:MAG: hypothetical protein GY749_50250 [Desulfobacteraceae bacterium]|nr:hypothetical protein [Desulfobacteraceae bacterium]